VAIGGASCGVFMGLELALDHPETDAFVSLGGPLDEHQKKRLSENTDLPILIASANEGPALEWSDALFESSANSETSVTKYKYVTHGTKLFQHVPEVQDEIVAWLLDKLE